MFPFSVGIGYGGNTRSFVMRSQPPSADVLDEFYRKNEQIIA